MVFEIVETSVLKVCKSPIRKLIGVADHYYLSENEDFRNSLGWGPSGLEVKGLVKITEQELERVERFMQAAKYSIAVNNCEHFANYVLHSINLSSQQHMWWKSLGAEVINLLQPVQGVRDNYSSFIGQQAAEILNENLRQAKIEQANRERIGFWKSRESD